MTEVPRTRKEFFQSLNEKLTTQSADQFHFKAFWLEVNSKLHPTLAPRDGWEQVERGFYIWRQQGPESTEPVVVWMDTSSPRIWVAYSFGSRKQIEKVLRTTVLRQKGVDRVWLPEPFLENLMKRNGYTDRGFRFSFIDSLAKPSVQKELPRFSAKFWIGDSPLPDAHQSFVSVASQTFTKSSLRMGRSPPDGEAGRSGLLLEVYSRGHMTVSSSDDPEEIQSLIGDIGETYAGSLGSLEARRIDFPRVVDFKFHTKLNLRRFQEMIESGVGPTRLWMQKYDTDGDLQRYVGVDLHTNDDVGLDIAESYAYLTVARNGCMNAAPRLMTLSSSRLSSRTDMSFEGVPLFA